MGRSCPMGECVGVETELGNDLDRSALNSQLSLSSMFESFRHSRAFKHIGKYL